MRVLAGCVAMVLLALPTSNAAQKAGTVKLPAGKGKKSKAAAESKTLPELSTKDSFVTGLLSGAVAGTTVDLVLYPLDTVKTRLQATAGAKLSMNTFRGLFNGVAPAIAASAPCAAVFFGAYDSLKRVLTEKLPDDYASVAHAGAAAGADLAQSVVRVPFEVIKQRVQAGVDASGRAALASVMKSQGPRGLYRGWGALALRDLPFDIIEFPLYEWFKSEWTKVKGEKLAPWQGSLCGSVAGGIAAGLTTPLDVVKTRLMTQSPGQYAGIGGCLRSILKEEGPGALFAGSVPRMTSIAFGGAIFFGAYETAKSIISVKMEERATAATAAAASGKKK
ncbi:unnamed protein product [Ectocarpus sp. 6 AP-2014]